MWDTKFSWWITVTSYCLLELHSLNNVLKLHWSTICRLQLELRSLVINIFGGFISLIIFVKCHEEIREHWHQSTCRENDEQCDRTWRSMYRYIRCDYESNCWAYVLHKLKDGKRCHRVFSNKYNSKWCINLRVECTIS